jgi:hypothetical protein
LVLLTTGSLRLGYKFHRSHRSRGITSWLTLVVEDVRVVVRDTARPPGESQDGSSPSSPVSPADPSFSTAGPLTPAGGSDGASIDPTSPPLSPTSPDKPRSALLSLNDATGSYFSPDLTPSLGDRLWSQYKYQARRLAERWLRSALNTLPTLVQVIDVEFTGSTVCRIIQEGVEDDSGSRPSLGLEAALTGGLRLHANIELSTAPAPRRRSAAAAPKVGYGLPAKRFRSSAMAIFQRGLGRAAGDASLTLECGPQAGLEVRALPASEASAGLKRVASGLNWFSSIGKDAKRGDGSHPRRNGSYASLSNVFATATASASTSPGKVSPEVSDPVAPLLSVGGPIKLALGHTFGPGIGLLSPRSVKLSSELEGDLVVDVNRLEELQRQRKQVTVASPAAQHPPHRDSRTQTALRKTPHPLQAVGDVRVHVKRLRASYSGASEAAEQAAAPSERLPLELVLLGLQVEGRASSADSNRLHHDWAGSTPDVQGHAFLAGADAVQVSVLPLPPSESGNAHNRPGLPSTLTFEAPSVEVFTTCLGSARIQRTDPGLIACIADLKSIELGMHVVDLQRLQDLLRARKRHPGPSTSDSQQRATPLDYLTGVPPQVVLAATLGQFKAELAVPSSAKPSEDNLLAFDCSGASLNIETDIRDVVRRPKMCVGPTLPCASTFVS